MAIFFWALASTASAVDAPRTLDWPELMPPGEAAPPPLWGHPPADIGFPQQEPQTGTFEVNPALDGLEVEMSGFVVPLDSDGGYMTAFLLVPYYGACIHMPPPPPNQIVFGKTSEPIKTPSLQSPVTVRGQLAAERIDSAMGNSAYTMAVDALRVDGR